MKLLMLVFLVISSQIVFGQDENDPTPSALFKAVPQNFIDNTLKIGTEIFNKSRSKSISIFAYGRFDGNTSNEPIYYGDKLYNGFGGEAQYRKYLSPLKQYTTRRNKNYLQGIYVGGYVQGASYLDKGDRIYTNYDFINRQQTSAIVTVHESIKNWGTGFTIGLQRTLWSVLFIDVYIGGGIQWSDVTRTITPGNVVNNSNGYYGWFFAPGYQGIMPKFGVQLGIPL